MHEMGNMGIMRCNHGLLFAPPSSLGSFIAWKLAFAIVRSNLVDCRITAIWLEDCRI